MSVKGYIVFDFDGTVVSSMSSVLRDCRAIVSELLGREVSEREMNEKADSDPQVFFSRFGIDVLDKGISEKLSQSWARRIGASLSEYAPFDGMLAFLERLKSEGYSLYVWTAGHRASVSKIFDAYKLSEYFIDYRCFDDTPPKPHPQGLLEMLSGIDPKRVIMIGDSYNDILGAQRFGCVSIIAKWDKTLEKHKCPYFQAKDEDFMAKMYGANFAAYSLDECYKTITDYFAGRFEDKCKSNLC